MNNIKKYITAALVLLLFFSLCTSVAVAIEWPIKPHNTARPISGTYGDSRGSEGFHLAVDIPAPDGTNVYCVKEGYIIANDSNTPPEWIQIGDTKTSTKGWSYTHIDNIPATYLVVGTRVPYHAFIGKVRDFDSCDHLDLCLDNLASDKAFVNPVEVLSPSPPKGDAPVVSEILFREQEEGNWFDKTVGGKIVIYDEVDIIAKAKNNMGPLGADWSPDSPGIYKIKYNVTGSNNIPTLVLTTFTGILIESDEPKIYDKDKTVGVGMEKFYYTVTNTNYDTNQHWYTKSKSAGALGNGVGGGKAGKKSEAYFKDGEYTVKVKAYGCPKHGDTGEKTVTVLVDNFPPTVESTYPTDGATNVPVDTDIVVTFDEEMDKNSVESAFSISPSVSGSKSWSNSNKTLRFNPSSDLKKKTTYTVTIGTGAKDLAGAAGVAGRGIDGDADGIEGPEYKWSFTTGNQPTVESSNAEGNRKDVFIKDDKVYANGSGYPKEIKTYKLYITNDATWTDKKSIASAGIIVTKDVTTDASGNISTTLIWDKAKIGKYDIVVDVNGSGKYDTSCDALDDKDVDDAGFVVFSKERSTANQIVSGDTIYIGEEGLVFDVDGDGDYGEAGTPDVGDLEGVPSTITTGAPPLHLSATYTVPEVTEGKYYYDANGNGELNPGEFHMYVKELMIAGDIILNIAAQDSIVGYSVPTSAEIVFKIETNFGGRILGACVDIELMDPDGVELTSIDGQALIDTTIVGTTMFVSDMPAGPTIKAPPYADALDLTDLDMGEYKVKFKLDKATCNMLDVSSPEYTFTVRREEVMIEAVEDVVSKGEDIVLWVRGNPKTYYYLTVTDVDVTAPPEIKDVGDVKALSGPTVISPAAPNLAAWVQAGGEGIAEVEIATTGADDRAYTIHVYETTAVLNPDAVGGPTYASDAVVAASALTTDDDDVDIKVEKAKVTFDMPASVVIGEEVTIKGAVSAGDKVDIVIEDANIVFDDVSIDEDKEFEVDWDTDRLTLGTYRIDVYIDYHDNPADPDPDDYEGIDEDGSTAIRLVSPELTAEQPRNVTAEDDEYEIEGTATGVDAVDIVLIGPWGYPFSDPGFDVLNGLEIISTSVTDDEFEEDIRMTDDLDTGMWKVLVLSPGRDGTYEDLGVGAGNLADIGTGLFVGKNQHQIVEILRDETVDAVGSDDLLVELTFRVESAYVRLDPIESVAVGEPLYVSGTTNREPGTLIVIWTFAGPVDLPAVLVEVEWPTPDEGVFNATIDTSDAVPATYTIEADDGDGHTDEVAVLLTSPGLTAEVSRTTVALGDDIRVRGVAPGTDNVLALAIAPKGTGGTYSI